MLQATDLKKRIESLIEREYMAREANDPNVSGQGPGPEGQGHQPRVKGQHVMVWGGSIASRRPAG